MNDAVTSRVRPLLVLWDVDHTLIENSGVSRETYLKAFELLTGRPSDYSVHTDGRTDPEIMTNMLLNHGIEPSEEYAKRIPDVLERAMSANVRRLRERGHALPGAHAVLAALRETPGIIQTVLSGNIQVNALAKLSAFDLHVHLDFDVGGYGSDVFVRANLVGIAQKRAANKYNTSFDRETTVLLGDTVRDVQAGINGGAYVIAVALGNDSVEALYAEGAHMVLRDLTSTEAAVQAITARWR